MDRGRKRILKEYVDGLTAYDLVLRDLMLPEYFGQVRDLCARLYVQGLNIDYFLTNFVLDAGGRLIYVDYERNAYKECWDFENWNVKYWSKTPELMEYVQQREGRAVEGVAESASIDRAIDEADNEFDKDRGLHEAREALGTLRRRHLG